MLPVSPTRPRWSWLFGLVVLVAWLVMPQAEQASEGYGVVTLDLRPDDTEVPTHLCVVSEAKGARTRDALRDVLEPQGDGDGTS